MKTIQRSFNKIWDTLTGRKFGILNTFDNQHLIDLRGIEKGLEKDMMIELHIV